MPDINWRNAKDNCDWTANPEYSDLRDYKVTIVKRYESTLDPSYKAFLGKDTDGFYRIGVDYLNKLHWYDDFYKEQKEAEKKLDTTGWKRVSKIEVEIDPVDAGPMLKEDEAKRLKDCIRLWVDKPSDMFENYR